MKKYAVIVAGGIGSRMNSPVPKQFMLLNGKPVIYYTIRSFLSAFDNMDIILVLPQDFMNEGQEIICKFFDTDGIKIIAGGKTRFDSVKNGLQLIREESIIFVHDAVRCLVSTDLIRRCFEEATLNGSAIPVIACKDSVRISTETGNKTLNRERIKLVQTPQTFRSNILLPAFNIDYKDQFTDEAAVVEAAGTKVFLVEGEEDNIKITSPIDLILAEYLLSDH